MPHSPVGRAAAALAIASLVVVAVLVSGPDEERREAITTPQVAETFRLADNLGSLATGFGAVWAADTSADQVLRIDPASHRVLARIPAPTAPAVAAGGGAVWAVGAPRSIGEPALLIRIDPRSDRVTARTPLRLPGGGRFEAFDVQMRGDVPWVLGPAGALAVDPRDGAAARYVPIEEREGDPLPLDAAITADGLVVLRRDQRLETYDLGSGRLNRVLPVRLPAATGFSTAASGPVFVDRDGRLAAADAVDGRILWTQRPGTGAARPPLALGYTLWTHASVADGDQLAEIDLKTGEVRSQTRLPEFGVAGAAMVGERLWLSTPGGRVMVVDVPGG